MDAAFRDPDWRGELVTEHGDEIATIMATEMGKLIDQGRCEVKLGTDADP